MSSSPASDLLGADFVRELEPPKIATAQRLAALGALGLIVFDVWYLTRDPRARSPVAAPPRPRVPERKAA